MAVLFACPYCQTETMVDDAYVGQSGPCAMCGRVVTVPTTLVRTVQVTSPRVSQAQPRSQQRGNVLMVLGVIIGSLFAGAAVITMIVAVVGPILANAQLSAQRAKNSDQLKQIVAALEQYHFEHGSYPPAYIADAKGTPLHSWRVLILPQLGEQALYQLYDFNQPWNSPTNMSIVSRMPEVYAAPGDDAALSSHETSYMVIVGQNTPFPLGGRTRTRNEFTDNMSDTILVVETDDSGVCWLEPKDLSASKMNYAINSGPTDCIRSRRADGAMAGFADGTSHLLPADLPVEYVEALTTLNQGEYLPSNLLDGK